jgi:hypothetical protein
LVPWPEADGRAQLDDCAEELFVLNPFRPVIASLSIRSLDPLPIAKITALGIIAPRLTKLIAIDDN